MADLPTFRYHLDPLGSGAIVASDARCARCEQSRGFVYSGPVFSAHPEPLDDRLCPWCIADGSAAAAFDAEFVPLDGEVADIPRDAQEELEKRTVSFTGWQEVEWLAHCDDAMAFVAYTTDGSPSGYVFRCLHCGTLRTYSDSA